MHSILLFGPGEAKGELAKRLATIGLIDRIVATDTVDKMTVPQIAANAREHFQKTESLSDRRFVRYAIQATASGMT